MSSSSIFKQVQELNEKGNFYDAQQMLKTLYHRNLNKRKFDEAVQLLFIGIKSMFQFEQFSLCLELGQNLLECLEQVFTNSPSAALYSTKFPISKSVSLNVIEMISAISNSFPETKEQSLEYRIRFLNDAIRFTSKKLKKVDESGDHYLHYLLAKSYWSTKKEYAAAHKHFIKSHFSEQIPSPYLKDHVQLVLEWAKQGYDHERDVFAFRSCLHLLCHKCASPLQQALPISQQFYQLYLELAPSPSTTTTQPLLHFLKWLFKAISIKNFDLFSKLQDQYEEYIIGIDSSLMPFLQEIPSIYFGKKKAGGGGFDALLNSLFGSLTGGGSSSNTPTASSQSASASSRMEDMQDLD